MRIQFTYVIAGVLILIHAREVSGLVLESPCCFRSPHIPGEFGNKTKLSEGFYNHELVAVEPFKACSPIKNQNLQGKIALVQRGDCNFVKKVLFAEKANASAVIVMDTSLREGVWEIIMQGDENGSLVNIPSAFVSYSVGEKLLLALGSVPPWKPVLVTLNETGEVVFKRTKHRLLKRIVTYIFLVSSVCLFSSALSSASSGLLRWISRSGRGRAARKLPVTKYSRKLRSWLVSNAPPVSTIKFSLIDEQEIGKDIVESDVEVCSVCLDDFEIDVAVKVLPCKHFFHVECITPWLENRSGCCPLCKQDAVKKNTQKTLWGVTLPFVDRVLSQEHVLHAIFLMLPASLMSCIIVNAAVTSIIEYWP